MNKENWLSILLDEPKLDDSIKKLVVLSYTLTAPKNRTRKTDAEEIEINKRTKKAGSSAKG